MWERKGYHVLQSDELESVQPQKYFSDLPMVITGIEAGLEPGLLDAPTPALVDSATW